MSGILQPLLASLQPSLDLSTTAMITLYLLTGIVTALCYNLLRRSKLDHIPTIGYSSPILSYISALRFFRHGRAIIEEGYRLYPNQVWKLATLEEWFIVANGTSRVEDISKAPDYQLDNSLSFAAYLQLDYTLGPEVTSNPYHVNVVRAAMTRNIMAQFDEMHDEMLQAFADVLPLNASNGNWVGLPIFETIVEVMSRISARLSVGFPLCDNKEFRAICNRSGAAITNGRMLRFFPKVLKQLASKVFLSAHTDLEALSKLLRPVIEFRLEQESLHGNHWPGKPNDLLTWMLEEAGRLGIERTSLDMATRIYFLAFASHTSSTMFMCALHEIATRPEYLQPLRDEVQGVIDREGWTKGAISKLYKMDSFFREIQRCYDMQLLHLGRKVMKDFVFSDGTVVPAGYTLYVNSHGSHHDEQLYPSPGNFDGFRFVREDSLEQPLMAKPTLDYNPFGYGKHACPGRFSAAYQLKTMLAHVIMTYDLKSEDGTHLSSTTCVEAGFNPNVEAKLYFRRRSELA
ncbi:hypothetical protein GALMADRAFT_713260 [Galerina marginata CBS 339.88]|uniref:Cytochrome P450 n=1 Tax=Galerina marginata (strain CBS 339.88) TaxID=685588 RepID=A0A067TMN0_GALM3|nr:hypothetical protein GALMADRAFT_713260 [Galerina marginata CBS 339.88]